MEFLELLTETVEELSEFGYEFIAGCFDPIELGAYLALISLSRLLRKIDGE